MDIAGGIDLANEEGRKPCLIRFVHLKGEKLLFEVQL
jgi:hypothetical protein